jgi:hypothetical protein
VGFAAGLYLRNIITWIQNGLVSITASNKSSAVHIWLGEWRQLAHADIILSDAVGTIVLFHSWREQLGCIVSVTMRIVTLTVCVGYGVCQVSITKEAVFGISKAPRPSLQLRDLTQTVRGGWAPVSVGVCLRVPFV